MEQVAPPFENLRARGLIVQSLVVAMALVAAPRLLSGNLSAPPNDPGTFALFYVGVAVVLIYRMRMARLDVERLFGPPPSRSTLALTLVAPPLAVLSMAGFWLLFLPLSFIAPAFVQKWAFDSMAVLSPVTLPEWIGNFAVAVIIAPVIEELFFRGLLLQRWASKYGTFAAVISSSALFAVGHVEVFGHFLFGIAMSALYLRTRSLWVPIATHSLNNLLVSLFTLPAAVAPNEPGNDMTLQSFQRHWWVGILVAIAGVALLEIYRRRFWAGIDLRELLHGRVPYASEPQAPAADLT